MLKKDITKKMLEQIAEAMNEVMGLEPPIETGRKIKRQDLFDDVLDASLDIQPEDLEDEAFTKDILKWLKVMGWEGKGEEDPAPDNAEDAGDSPDPENPEPAKDEPEPPQKKGKIGKAGKFSRIEAAIIGLKNNNTIKAANEEANELYVKGGGKDNVGEASFFNRTALRIMAGLGVAKMDGDKYTIGE